MKQRFSKTVKVIAFLNTYYSYQGSDFGDNVVIKDVMDFAQREVEKITGLHISEIPADTDQAITYLKKLLK